MKKLALAFSALLLILSSCSSSDSSSSSTTDVLPKKSIYTDDDGTYTTLFTYNGNKIVTAISDDDTSIEFTYTGDLITKIEYFEGSTLDQTDTYTYNSSNQLVTFLRITYLDDYGDRTTYVYNSDGTISFTDYSGDSTSQTMVDRNGKIFFENNELVKTEFYIGSSSTLFNTLTYTYDTKNNPFKNVTGFDKTGYDEGYTQGVNRNILTILGTAFNSDDATYDYTYNSSNYPTNVLETFTFSGMTTSTQYFYE